MAPHLETTIVPADYPELNRLAWNRDPRYPIDVREAFALYERNWRFVDREHLTEREALLIDKLGERFGNGFKLM